MVRVHQDPPSIRSEYEVSYQPSRIWNQVWIADNWKRLSCSLKIWKKFVHVSLMRREVDMGLDCIFDTLIPTYLDEVDRKFREVAVGLKVWRIKFSYTPMTRCCCLNG